MFNDHRPMPTGIILVLRPKGNARVAGRYEVTSRDGRTRLGGEWQVVELWTLDAAELLAQNEVGLIPWATLARQPGPPEEFLKDCRERIERDAPTDRREGLLAVTGILAAVVYNQTLVDALFGRIDKVNVMDFPSLRRLFEEEKAEARQEGFREARHAARVDDIVGILAARLKTVPEDLGTRLNAVTDDARLTQLRDIAATCPDLEAFRLALAGG